VSSVCVFVRGPGLKYQTLWGTYTCECGNCVYQMLMINLFVDSEGGRSMAEEPQK